jgi:imidazolonepropionase-like amidohydrolase
VNAMGAKFLTGSNAATCEIMPGSGLHLELTLLDRIGFSPREALAAATSNYADVYGWRDVGRIEPRRAADLLLLDVEAHFQVTERHDNVGFYHIWILYGDQSMSQYTYDGAHPHRMERMKDIRAEVQAA